jgi:hypothetical protein
MDIEYNELENLKEYIETSKNFFKLEKNRRNLD